MTPTARPAPHVLPSLDTVLAALRMPNADTTSKTPMTISQMPTTMARVRIDSNGEAITTMPAMRLITPTKICQPRPGRVGSLMAATVVATPRKTNPTPIQMASSKTA